MGTGRGLRWESGPEEKGLIVVCGFPQTPWPLVGVVGREIKVFPLLGYREGRRRSQTHGFCPQPLTPCAFQV